MLDNVFLWYGTIMSIYLEKNFENMCKAWDPQKLVETIFKQIHNCVEFSEAGDITIDEAQNPTTAYTKILTNATFNSACRLWDEKVEAYNNWDNLNIHFANYYRQHRQMHG